MADIVKFPGITRHDLDADSVLQDAMGYLDTVVICGIAKDGNEYFASSAADGADALWHLERAKHALMKITDELENGHD